VLGSLHSGSAVVFLLGGVAAIALLARIVRRWHLRAGFKDLEQILEGLPYRLKRSAKRLGSKVLIKHKYKGRSVELKFSKSDFEPELQVRFEAAAAFRLKVVRRNPSADARAVNGIQTGDVYFDRRFEIDTSDPETLRMLFLTKAGAGQFKKLCYSTSALRMHKGTIEAAYDIAPRQSMLLKEDLDAMSALADTLTRLPELHREKLK
jgi:hypothetical protein